MLPPRRFLPSFSLLAAFEAAARSGSVTAAANELGLTQSAVSRQIASGASHNLLHLSRPVDEKTGKMVSFVEAVRRLIDAGLDQKSGKSD